ncbi:hypothetical protein [Persicitalea sp.]|uniref:hypothetical protein n=1 Tax=Persicitalea sp. TaxID=3100273 RepID=UPI003593DB03
MENVSGTIDAFFILITFVTVGLLYLASPKSKWLLIGVGIWMAIQAFLALSGFYQVQTIPPRFVLTALPPALFIAALFLTSRGRAFIDSLDTAKLTILHTVRIVVELILYFLFLASAIPEIMTFEGRNLDILAGLTAPLVYYYGFKNKVLPTSSLLLWNLICVGLLLNIVVIAILSTPSPFQKFGLDQPNIAIISFPYVWLPSVVVPIVFFSHFATIRRLLSKK